MSLREISRILKISRNTVRSVIRNGDTSEFDRESKYTPHLQVIKELLRNCRGNIVRVQEELASRHNITIPYQTLTWIIRKHGLGKKKRNKRAGEYEFRPGEEMQHDTLPIILNLVDAQ